jgi:hypothetical protein
MGLAREPLTVFVELGDTTVDPLDEIIWETTQITTRQFLLISLSTVRGPK